MNSKDTVEILFSSYRRKILSLLLCRPKESFYVREIGRMTGIPAGSLHRELRLIANTELISRTTQGNQVRYQANSSHPLFKELASIFRKTTGIADVIRSALAEHLDDIDFA